MNASETEILTSADEARFVAQRASVRERLAADRAASPDDVEAAVRVAGLEQLDASLSKKLTPYDARQRAAEEKRALAENAARRTADAQEHAERLAALARLGDDGIASLAPFDAALEAWRQERKKLAEYVVLAGMNGDILAPPETESELIGRLNEVRRKAGMRRGFWLFAE